MTQTRGQTARLKSNAAPKLAQRLLGNVSGAGLIEYSLLAALISLVTVSALSIVADEQDDTYDCLSASIEIGQDSIHCDKIGKRVKSA